MCAIQQAPRDDAKLCAWHRHADVLPFLQHTRTEDVPVYLSSNGFFLYSMIVPEERIAGDYVTDMLKWNFAASSGYGHGYSHEAGGTVPFCSSPMEQTGTKRLEGATAIFFLREMIGTADPGCYVEINQRVSHVLDLHWIREKNAWCRMNVLGEQELIARYDKDKGIICATLRQEDLDYFMFLTKSVLVRCFDVSRFNDDQALMSTAALPLVYTRRQNKRQEIFAQYMLKRDKGNPLGSVLRGFQIVRCRTPQKELLLRLRGEEPRRFETFIIQDFKKNRVVEWSCDPERLGNYFTPSKLPLSTSPAFFKAEVLHQYQADPARYEIDQRTIKCRGGWSLHYDVNEEGQLHVLIKDLGDLPHAVQLQWKAQNEKPRGTISKRSFITDFLGQWDTSYDPLSSLKRILEQFPAQDGQGRTCIVWRMPSLPPTRDIRALNYVRTEARKEWESQIQILDQILVEGLHSTEINRIAEVLGCREKTLASMKQLRKVLDLKKVSAEELAVVFDPLIELQLLRSKKVSHAGSAHASGNLKDQFRKLVEQCDKAMRVLATIVQSGILYVA